MIDEERLAAKLYSRGFGRTFPVAPSASNRMSDLRVLGTCSRMMRAQFREAGLPHVSPEHLQTTN